MNYTNISPRLIFAALAYVVLTLMIYGRFPARSGKA